MIFSQRNGIKPVKSFIQIDSIDDELRNNLWNAAYLSYFKPISRGDVRFGNMIFPNESINALLEKLQINYFKEPLDTLSSNNQINYNSIKSYFFKCEWYEVYDFIEFITKKYDDEAINENFIRNCNTILEEETSGYRFVGNNITKITSDEEINATENAMKDSHSHVSDHLKRALELLTDRKNPDYRNSVKESISAVESICKMITGNQKATLGRALDEIANQGQIELHANLKEGFKKLYNYTSDSGGIRHAIKDNSTVEYEDAQFMLVICSAFINYLISKSAKAGIKISP